MLEYREPEQTIDSQEVTAPFEAPARVVGMISDVNTNTSDTTSTEHQDAENLKKKEASQSREV